MGPKETAAEQTSMGPKETAAEQTPTSPKETTETPSTTRGGPGAICQCGRRAVQMGQQSDCKAVQCDDNLVCAYGCGIPGCDSTCMTPEEAAKARTRP